MSHNFYTGNITRKILIILIFLLAIPSFVIADSSSLNTEITTVSFGPHGLGRGFAPTGTNFMYSKSFQMAPSLQYKAYFFTRLIFSATNDKRFEGFNYKTGTPLWINKYSDIYWNSDYYLSGLYFSPEASVTAYLEQGFGTNPVSGSGPLLTVGIDFTSRYSKAYEPLDVKKGRWDSFFYDAEKNEYKKPFGPNSEITAYPWLQDNRSSLVNSISISTSINLTKYRGWRVNDGMYGNVRFEFGPYWLGNTISMNSPTSNYFSFSTYWEEYITLYSKEQSNGMNWLSIMFTHQNSYGYTGGSVIPEHKLPGDRLNQYFTDSYNITFQGPQFIARDCYTDITLSLYNSWQFGHILNEPDKQTQASQWNSSLGMSFHMRLFGFMHFSYNLGYTIFSGIHMYHPGFWQNAKISFYIAL